MYCLTAENRILMEKLQNSKAGTASLHQNGGVDNKNFSSLRQNENNARTATQSSSNSIQAGTLPTFNVKDFAFLNNG